jgi:hypothetical protein
MDANKITEKKETLNRLQNYAEHAPPQFELWSPPMNNSPEND